jgi:hypothetical protein
MVLFAALHESVTGPPIAVGSIRSRKVTFMHDCPFRLNGA